MAESGHNYEEDIRRLMSDLSTDINVNKQTTAEKSVADVPVEDKHTIRLSGAPVAASTDELPLILSEVAYLAADTPLIYKAEEEFVPLLPTDNEVTEECEDAAAEDVFIQQYLDSQDIDNESDDYKNVQQASFFGRQMFRYGDSVSVTVRKSLFWLIAVLLTAALAVGVIQLGILPLIAAQQEQHLADVYDPDVDGTVDEQDGRYPTGMLASLCALYDINPQLSGHIQYHAAADEDFLNIHSPVVYAGNNTTYLNTDFSGDRSADGALFIDERCGGDDVPLTIIHGKNAVNGRSFAGLNSLVGSVYNARAAASLTYSTLYEKNEYYVFAVVLTDKSATGSASFDTCRTSFSDDADFEAYIEAVKAHSLFDYGIDVSASDDVLVLVTDASTSVAKIGNARITVYARRVRDNDLTSLIVKNNDVIMPLAWYTAQGLKPHSFYTGGGSSTKATTTTTTTATTTTTTTTATTPATTTVIPADTTTTTTTTTTAEAEPTTSTSFVGIDGVVEME